ncbi:hypothetical protein QL093DRAFT_2581832 [Fusarium oxysporum]|nr:hypothetical protein QL093DRAFT_2581832 [Fusarium oxysporum]
MPQKQPLRPKSRDEFGIAILCALTLEADAVLTLFDRHWDEDGSHSYGKARGDPNAYSTGVIGQHNVVLAHLPGMGKITAGQIASFCRMSYVNVSLALVVGICGGAPFYGKAREEILLGDVIISTGVVQYDYGSRYPDMFKEKDTLDDAPGRPGLELRSLLSKLKTKREHGKLQTATQNYLQQASNETTKSAGRPKGLYDNLFPAEYRHKHQEPSRCSICADWKGKSDPVCDVALGSTCEKLGCDIQQRLFRRRLGEVKEGNEKERIDSNNETPFPRIHFGKFASGDMVIKSGEFRDQLTTSKGAIGFEMESVGVWEIFPSVVIKGVSDYADSHKNDDWQDYAAASAAACTKAFLKYWDSTKEEMELEKEKQKLRETIIKSLHFPEINERKNDLTPPAPTTFQWVLQARSGDSVLESEECSDQEDREAQNQDQGKLPKDALFGKSYRTQKEDSSGVFKPADDRSQSSYDGSLDSGDFDSDDDDNDDELFPSSPSDVKWDSFTDWLVSDQQIYWISGNPGSGKSTLMKYLSENRKTSKYLTKWRKGTVILSHFFWRPGTRMQQSFKGLLCSLLCDLLSKSPDSVQIVHDMSMKAQRLSTSDWSQQELSKILLDYCKHSSQPICLFVDGLDETLQGQDAFNTVQFLKSLTSSKASVKTCVSSRPERLFRLHFDTCPSLKMHELTLFDIARYSKDAMVKSTLLKPRGAKLSDLAFHISMVSDGIFLWAVLVTQSLIRGINNGDSSEQTWERLLLMPQDLMDLYHDILSRSSPDRPIYKKDISLILNLLFLAAPSEAEGGTWPITPFMLMMATNSHLLERYVDRGDTIKEHKLRSKVKSMKDILEAAFAGLVVVKCDRHSHQKSDIIEKVAFPHRSARDFLLDTVEGRNLWQLCDIPQEELLVRYFKSLIADGRLCTENPDSKFSRGVDIRDLLSNMFKWEQKYSCPQDVIASLLELARVCFLRGYPKHRWGHRPELKPRCAKFQFLSHAVCGGSLRYVRGILDEQGATALEDMYRLLFSLCNPGTFDIRAMKLIEYILEQGYSPNWSTVNTPTTTGHQLVASPWFRFLINLLDAPWSFFPDKPEPERGRLILETIQMFLKSGASLESIFPVVVRVTGIKEPSMRINLANYLTFPPGALLEQYMSSSYLTLLVIIICLTDAGLKYSQSRDATLNKLKATGWKVALGADMARGTFRAMIAVIHPCRVTGVCNSEQIYAVFSNYLTASYKLLLGPIIPILNRWRDNLDLITKSTGYVMTATDEVKGAFNDVEPTLSGYYDSICNWLNYCGNDRPNVKRFMTNVQTVITLSDKLSTARQIFSFNTKASNLLGDVNKLRSNWAYIPPANEMISRIRNNEIKVAKDVFKFMPVVNGIMLAIDWEKVNQAEFDNGDQSGYYVRNGLISIQDNIKKELAEAVKVYFWLIRATDSQLKDFTLTNGRWKMEYGTVAYQRWSTIDIDMPCTKMTSKTEKKDGLTKTSNQYRTYWKCHFGPHTSQYQAVHVPYVRMYE